MAYINCKWCHGKGCLACESEHEKDIGKAKQPLFVADLNNPDDMALLKSVFGREAIEEAFKLGGGGMRRIKQNAAIASLSQHMRRAREGESDESQS